MPVYYCLDGIKDDDVIYYKTRKTAAINEFLKGSLNRKRHVEVITLAETREILLNWDELQTVVKFYRRGELLPPARSRR
ncbi:hypothetical protein [Phytohabitans rumicis]|uniref:Uncharacterized protein n=1 Tax=Phytohabitans rumicis TaxID=1076125 RepID=A0A6V8KPG3_9ACTN|nr:hypothetical protein [Phytohabitans rumicis]GFJ87052.1 hypothetical protein Prum_006940 [Phytohabitans rumicis]